MMTGYALLLANPAVVRWAVKQLGLTPQAADYDDYVSLGEARYLYYFDRMQPPLKTPQQQAKFNRDAAWRIYRDLNKHRLREKRRGSLEQLAPQPPVATGVDTTRLEVAEALVDLWPKLTPQAQAVLQLRFDSQLTNREIAARLKISVQRVWQLTQQIQQAYQRGLTPD
ncbi:sigma-70 family RNA polymerase sigma factor [Lacticaseibacillus baoqingensis]|uniref:Sigma-70 family RNA polymerase sigma factor n=1 Tax=Lacticaseibacillus baoqingensis TaxID=2486013 RepID=A0ABW4E5N1_9LACO|nr:sigma-70 family RNA polymerase sigma factor [Lacticaseibacillus baoqingensis]